MLSPGHGADGRRRFRLWYALQVHCASSCTDLLPRSHLVKHTQTNSYNGESVQQATGRLYSMTGREDARRGLRHCHCAGGCLHWAPVHHHALWSTAGTGSALPNGACVSGTQQCCMPLMHAVSFVFFHAVHCQRSTYAPCATTPESRESRSQSVCCLLHGCTRESLL